MKKLVLSVLFAMALPFAANASDKSWKCELKFKGEVGGVRILIGASKFDAKGTLSCANKAGDTETIKIGLKGKSRLIAPGIQLGAYKMVGETKAIRLANGKPSDLLGDYTTLSAGVAVPVGLNAFIAQHQNYENVKLVFSINLTAGVGVNVGISEFEIYEL